MQCDKSQEKHTGPWGLPIWQVPVTKERQAQELLAVRIPKDITLSSRVELFTNTVISPQMQLLLQLIKRTIKTKAISQVHRPQSSSQLSTLRCSQRAELYSVIQKMTGRSY